MRTYFYERGHIHLSRPSKGPVKEKIFNLFTASHRTPTGKRNIYQSSRASSPGLRSPHSHYPSANTPSSHCQRPPRLRGQARATWPRVVHLRRSEWQARIDSYEAGFGLGPGTRSYTCGRCLAWARSLPSTPVGIGSSRRRETHR